LVFGEEYEGWMSPLFNRFALDTTDIELVDIANSAKIGWSSPKIASGIAAAL